MYARDKELPSGLQSDDRSTLLAHKYWTTTTDIVRDAGRPSGEVKFGTIDREGGYHRFIRVGLLDAAMPGQTANRLGAPEEFFAKLLQVWKLGINDAAVLLGLSASGTARVKDLLDGFAYFEARDEKDRVAELFQIRKLLHGIFRNRDAENQWLREPQPRLGHAAPLDLLLEGSWENLLRLRQFVESTAGL